MNFRLWKHVAATSGMDRVLRCNVLTCRKSLSGQVYITSCSHIFCKECSARHFQKLLTCPACKTTLTEKCDVFMTDLQPSDEWKSMIITGLHPEAILDICNRAMSFWIYQTCQEQCYQESLVQDLQHRLKEHEQQLQTAHIQFKTDITSLNEKIQGLTKQCQTEKQKNAEYIEQYQEKAKQMRKLQLVCDHLKKKLLHTATTEDPGPWAWKRIDQISPSPIEDWNEHQPYIAYNEDSHTDPSATTSWNIERSQPGLVRSASFSHGALPSNKNNPFINE